MTVAVVIPHWNRIDLLRELMANLREQTRPFDEWIVVDNGSTDGSAEAAEEAGARVLRLGKNFGFAAAVNRGIEATRADFVAILNNDVTLDPDWLRAMLEGISHVSFASGKILRASDAKIIDGTFDEISRGACAWRAGAGKPDSVFWSALRPIRFTSMTAALFRRDLFDQAGLLDERFGSYLEDVDFGLCCAALGKSGIYLPDAVAFHRGSATRGAWNSDTVFQISRNQVLLTLKHFHDEPRWPIVAGQLLWGLLALRHAAGFSWLRGKVSGLRLGRTIRGDCVGGKRDLLHIAIETSENVIFELQQQTGFDWYWRVYFCLLRR